MMKFIFLLIIQLVLVGVVIHARDSSNPHHDDNVSTGARGSGVSISSGGSSPIVKRNALPCDSILPSFPIMVWNFSLDMSEGCVTGSAYDGCDIGVAGGYYVPSVPSGFYNLSIQFIMYSDIVPKYQSGSQSTDLNDDRGGVRPSSGSSASSSTGGLAYEICGFFPGSQRKATAVPTPVRRNLTTYSSPLTFIPVNQSSLGINNLSVKQIKIAEEKNSKIIEFYPLSVGVNISLSFSADDSGGVLFVDNFGLGYSLSRGSTGFGPGWVNHHSEMKLSVGPTLIAGVGSNLFETTDHQQKQGQLMANPALVYNLNSFLSTLPHDNTTSPLPVPSPSPTLPTSTPNSLSSTISPSLTSGKTNRDDKNSCSSDLTRLSKGGYNITLIISGHHAYNGISSNSDFVEEFLSDLADLISLITMYNINSSVVIQYLQCNDLRYGNDNSFSIMVIVLSNTINDLNSNGNTTANAISHDLQMYLRSDNVSLPHSGTIVLSASVTEISASLNVDSNQSTSSSSVAISTGAIVGICIGGVVALMICSILLFCLVIQNNKSKTSSEGSQSSANTSKDKGKDPQNNGIHSSDSSITPKEGIERV